MLSVFHNKFEIIRKHNSMGAAEGVKWLDLRKVC